MLFALIITVPLLWLKVPALTVKFPLTVNVPGVDVNVPPDKVKVVTLILEHALALKVPLLSFSVVIATTPDGDVSVPPEIVAVPIVKLPLEKLIFPVGSSKVPEIVFAEDELEATVVFEEIVRLFAVKPDGKINCPDVLLTVIVLGDVKLPAL